MLEKILNHAKKSLAGAFLLGSLAVGGCSVYVPKPGTFISDNVALPGFGVSAIATAAIFGGPIRTESVVENGVWRGVKTSDYHWNGHKFGEVYFQFPDGARDVAFVRQLSNVHIAYTTDRNYGEHLWAGRTPSFKLKAGFFKKYVQDEEGKWKRDRTPPEVRVFNVVKDNYGREEYIPVNAPTGN